MINQILKFYILSFFVLEPDDWVCAIWPCHLFDSTSDFQESEVEKLLSAFFVLLLMVILCVLLQCAVFLVYLDILGDNRPRFSIFWLRKYQLQPRRSAKYPLPYKLLIFHEISFRAINIRFQENKSPIYITLIQYFINKQQYLIECQLICPNFYRLL